MAVSFLRLTGDMLSPPHIVVNDRRNWKFSCAALIEQTIPDVVVGIPIIRKNGTESGQNNLVCASWPGARPGPWVMSPLSRCVSRPFQQHGKSCWSPVSLAKNTASMQRPTLRGSLVPARKPDCSGKIFDIIFIYDKIVTARKCTSQAPAIYSKEDFITLLKVNSLAQKVTRAPFRRFHQHPLRDMSSLVHGGMIFRMS